MFRSIMFSQPLDQWSHLVHIVNNSFHKFIKPVRHAEIQRRYKHHFRLLQLKLGLKQASSVVFSVCVLQEIVEWTMNAVKEAIEDHIIQIVYISSPDFGRRLGFKKLQVILKDKMPCKG